MPRSKGSKAASKRKRADDMGGATIGTSETAKSHEVEKEEDLTTALPSSATPATVKVDAVHPPAKRKKVEAEDQGPIDQPQGQATPHSLLRDVLAMTDRVRQVGVKTVLVVQKAEEADMNDAKLLIEEAAEAQAEATAQMLEASRVFLTAATSAIENGERGQLLMAAALAAVVVGTYTVIHHSQTLLHQAKMDMLEERSSIDSDESQSV
ncbi:hypothetical protein BKA82DRAFT_991334 [Pisolithus tinctorius]|uniref:Uncharacterized protein n=1 Tax=Pisolithus tinctorius Marx 270 TaxID=870435 RepID=A0A0C3PZ21_PISTI|nr:hypothetical protein BKA82DRAFT_991334 [Pisolithus tinctorius]KIO14574.1 hypothetical protein M404DRAFT_991334 [Pisolithus tinctorius Marx 270]